MIFCEYIARDRGIPLEVFRHHGKQDWTSEGDRMVANLARTMKVGPEPHYMCWWKISGMRRMDEWESYFGTPEGRDYAARSPVPRVMNFYGAGLYDEIIEGEIRPGLLHYVEFFDPASLSADDIRDSLVKQVADHSRLAFVIRRVGLLGPDPGGIAVWSFPDYVSAETFVRSRPGTTEVRLVSAGFYRNFGEDVP